MAKYSVDVEKLKRCLLFIFYHKRGDHFINTPRFFDVSMATSKHKFKKLLKKLIVKEVGCPQYYLRDIFHYYFMSDEDIKAEVMKCLPNVHNVSGCRIVGKFYNGLLKESDRVHEFDIALSEIESKEGEEEKREHEEAISNLKKLLQAKNCINFVGQFTDINENSIVIDSKDAEFRDFFSKLDNELYDDEKYEIELSVKLIS